MYTRFMDIVNTLGKTFSNNEKVKRIIRCLPNKKSLGVYQKKEAQENCH